MDSPGDSSCTTSSTPASLDCIAWQDHVTYDSFASLLSVMDPLLEDLGHPYSTHSFHRFLDLPPELRNSVYHYYFSDSDSCSPCYYEDIHTRPFPSDLPDLCYVDHGIGKEATKYFVFSSVFYLEIGDWAPPSDYSLRWFRHALCQKNSIHGNLLPSISRISIEWDVDYSCQYTPGAFYGFSMLQDFLDQCPGPLVVNINFGCGSAARFCKTGELHTFRHYVEKIQEGLKKEGRTVKVALYLKMDMYDFEIHRCVSTMDALLDSLDPAKRLEGREHWRCNSGFCLERR